MQGFWCSSKLIYAITTFLLLVIFALLIMRRAGVVSPSVIWSGSFFLAVTAAFVGQSQWDDVYLSVALSALILVSVALFALVSLVIEKSMLRKVAPEMSRVTVERATSAFALPTICAICVFALLTWIAYLGDIQAIVNDGLDEGADLFAVIDAYRNYTIGVMKGGLEESGKISTFSSLCFRALEVIAVVVVANFVFLPNDAKKASWKRYAFCVFLIASVLFFSTGSRSPLIHLIIAGIILVGLYLKLCATKLSLRLVLKVGLLFLLALVAFALLSIVRGESMRLGFVGYISFFLGSGVASFNQIFDSNLLLYMAEPFSGIANLLEKLDLGSVAYNEPVWIAYEGYDSNVFTALSSYYAHFGIFGVAFYCVGLAGGSTLLYVKALNSRSLSWISAYAFFGYALFDAIRSDALSSLIGVPLIEYVFFLAVAPIVLSKIDEMVKGAYRFAIPGKNRNSRLTVSND